MWTMALKEIRENILTLRYQVAAALLAGLVGLSVVLGGVEYRAATAAHRYSMNQSMQERDEEASLRELYERTLRHQPAASPHALLAYGLTDFLTRPLSFRMDLWRDMPVVLEPPEVEAGLAGLFPRPDLVYVSSVVGFLLALAFVHDCIAGERVRGTLRLVLASPVPRLAVVLGKLAGAFVSLLLPFAVALALGAGVLLAVAPQALFDMQPATVAAILGLTLLFLLWVSTLGVALSCWCRRPATALLAGLFLWILFAGAVPAIAPLLAARMQPVPAAKQQDLLRIQTSEEIEDDFDRMHAGQLNSMDDWLEKRSLKRQGVLREVDGPAHQQSLAQVRLVRSLCLASPVATYLLACAELAGTGVEAYAVHAEAARKHNRDLDAAILDRFRKLRDEDPEEHLMSLADQPVSLDFLPVFEEPAPPSRAVGRAVAPGLLVLLAATFVQILVATLGFLRYDPL